MRRRLTLLALALSFASEIAVPGSLLAGVTEPAPGSRSLGFVGPASPSTGVRAVAQFWNHLRELGYIEGRNLVIEARWAEGRYERLPELMAEVVGRKVDVLVTYSTPGAVAAKMLPARFQSWPWQWATLSAAGSWQAWRALVAT